MVLEAEWPQEMVARYLTEEELRVENDFQYQARNDQI